MGEEDYQQQAKLHLVTYLEGKVGLWDVYVVWFAKTLQNWKALLSTNLPDGRYYELTFNGDKNELYLDTYEKKSNVVIPG
jgi:hypothetical protein